MALLSREGYAASLLQNSNEAPTLFRIKTQKLSLYDLRRHHYPAFGFFHSTETKEEQRSAWMYHFYKAILFPEHFFW